MRKFYAEMNSTLKSELHMNCLSQTEELTVTPREANTNMCELNTEATITGVKVQSEGVMVL